MEDKVFLCPSDDFSWMPGEDFKVKSFGPFELGEAVDVAAVFTDADDTNL